MRRATVWTCAIALIASAASFAPASLRDLLLWREEAPRGEVWRWISAHFVHLSPTHLVTNLGAMFLLLVIYRQWHRSHRDVIADGPSDFAAGLSMLGVNLALAAGVGDIAWYGGLSGILHGMFAWLSLLYLAPPSTRSVRVLAVMLWLGGLVKSLDDLAVPVGTVGWLGVPLATPTHLAGYLGGSLAAALLLWRLRWK